MSRTVSKALGAWAVLAVCVGLTGCAAASTPASQESLSNTSSASQSATSSAHLPHSVEATLSARDRRAVLALAKREYDEERADHFERVREAPVTPAEEKQAVLGDIEFDYEVFPAELASASSLFAAIRQSSSNYVSVPITLGRRRLADMGFKKTASGWEWYSTICESQRIDRARAEVESRFVSALGGSPDETRAVTIAGSMWVIARRGNHEAAGFIDTRAYGSFGSPYGALPPAGTVMTADQFRVFLGKV